MIRFETTLGSFTVELFEKEAPISAKNFLDYAEAGHFDGTVFHRVIPGFVIQGGGMTADMRQKADARADPQRSGQRTQEPPRHAVDGTHQ